MTLKKPQTRKSSSISRLGARLSRIFSMKRAAEDEEPLHPVGIGGPKSKISRFGSKLSRVFSTKSPRPPVAKSVGSEEDEEEEEEKESFPTKQQPAVQLPSTVFVCIAEHLRVLYSNAATESCESCLLRNLSAASRTCKSWHNGLVPVLYGRIYVAAEDSPAIKKKPVAEHSCRLHLLHRTLLARPDHAAHVRELTLPSSRSNNVENIRLESIIAAIVDRCPNLERLMGIYPPFQGSENPIHRALSSRTKLREHLWLIETMAPLQHADSEAFVTLHTRWRALDTLVMQGHTPSSGGRGLSHLLFASVFSSLPRLRRVMVSRFQRYEFNDTTLLSLPAKLSHLRLGKLPGVTEAGLARFVNHAHSIISLSLLDLELLDLATISGVLARLRKLERFTLLQTAAPYSEPETTVASESLGFLHWDTLASGPANDALARSIRRGLFPRLHTLRAPTDFDGVLQAVCRPCARIQQPLDAATARSRTRQLPAARMEAQRRIEAAAARTRLVLATSSGDDDSWEFDWMGWNGSYKLWRRRVAVVEEIEEGVCGDPKSGVRYMLEPDVGGGVDAVCRVGDVLARFGGEGEEEEERCEGGHVRKRREEESGVGMLF